MTNKEIIKSIKERLTPFIEGAQYILYGSRARGDYRDDSDVDLIILLPDEYTGKKFVEIQEKITEKLYQLELEWQMKVEISPVMLTKKMFHSIVTPFTKNVTQEGIAL